MIIYLLRHGQTNVNKSGKCQGAIDKELNNFGKAQADLLGKRLENYDIEIIYSSDLKRVMQTSEIINRYIKKDIIIKEELREINMGDWDATTVEERYLSHGDYAREWHKHLKDLPYPNGECGEDVLKRAMKVIDIIIKSEHERAAVVTSGGTIMTLLSYFLGLEQHKRFNLGIDNCSLSIIEYKASDNKFVVKCVNDTSHLDGVKDL